MNCGHAHADALAFELAIDGQAVFVDPGTFTYTASALSATPSGAPSRITRPRRWRELERAGGSFSMASHRVGQRYCMAYGLTTDGQRVF